MSDEANHFVIAPAASDLLPADWQARVGALRGVSVTGGYKQSLQVRADDEAVEAMRQLFGGALRIEAARPRRPA